MIKSGVDKWWYSSKVFLGFVVFYSVLPEICIPRDLHLLYLNRLYFYYLVRICHTERATDDLEMNQHHEEAIRPRHSAFSKWQKRWIIFLASFAGWFSTLSSFIFFPAIPTLAQDLHTSIGKVNLTVTSYLIFAAVAPSIVGNFADTSGRRPAYIATLTVYIVANIGLATQNSFTALVILRMLQSASISGTTFQIGVNLCVN